MNDEVIMPNIIPSNTDLEIIFLKSELKEMGFQINKLILKMSMIEEIVSSLLKEKQEEKSDE